MKESFSDKRKSLNIIKNRKKAQTSRSQIKKNSYRLTKNPSSSVSKAEQKMIAQLALSEHRKPNLIRSFTTKKATSKKKPDTERTF